MHAVIVAAAAHAGDPSPARQCAEAAVGTEVEVCLRVAIENPRAVDEIAAALIALVDRAEQPDRELLDALLLLFSPDRAPDGARRLGSLGDPRAVPVLQVVATTREPEVSAAAVAALAAYAEGVPVLAGWLVDPARPLPLRLAAADALGASERAAAGDALEDATRRPRLPAELRERITAAVARHPGRTVPDELPPAVDGAAWLATGTSLGLGYAMGTAGHFGRTRNLWAVGTLTGGVAGATSGWLYARAWPLEAGDAAFVTIDGAGGALAGGLVGAGLGSGSVDTALLAGLGGEIAGFALGGALAGVHPGTADDAVEAGTIALLAGAAAAAADRAGRRPRADLARSGIAAGIGVAGGLVLGHLAAPRADLVEGLPLVATGAVVGAASGLLAPIPGPIGPPLPIAGAFGGATVGALLCAPADPRSDVLVGVWTGGAFGVGVGGGAGLLAAPDEPHLARGAALAGLATGAAVGAWVAYVDPDPIDDRDVALSLAATAWTAWNASAVGWIAGDGPGDPRGQGAILLVTSSAGSVATALNVALDVPVPHTLSATSLGLWGGYAGGAAATLSGLDPLVLALPLSDAGLVVGALLVSPLVSTPPLVIGIADAGGVLGASVAGLTAGVASADRDVVLGASLGGAAIGLASGAAVGTAWHRSGSRRDVAFAGRITLLPMPGATGALLRVDGW